MLINQTAIMALFKNITATFRKGLEESKPMWAKFATKVPSTGTSNDYSWIKDGWPNLREWVGDKVVKYLSASAYVIHNKSWEATIGVKRDNLEDDNHGIYAPIVRAHGVAAAAWPDQLVATLFNGVFTEECFDGQYMCDTDHPVGKGTVSNKLTKMLDGSTLTKAMGSYGAARTAMMSQKNENGNPLDVTPNLLVVPPALEAKAKLLMTADKLGDNSPNPYKGTAEVVVWPRLTSASAWFLLDGTKPLMPFIFQERKAPKPVSQTDPNSDDVFNTATFKFSVEARGNAGYGFWQLIHGSTGTVA